MNKIPWLVFLFIFLISLFLLTRPASGQAPVDFSTFTPITFTPGTHTGLGLVQLLLALKGDSESLLAGIDARQAYALANGGRYFQILRDSSTLPVDGALLPPNQWALTPTDQPFSLSGIRLLSNSNVNLPFSFAIDAYDGPAGKGYVLRFMVTIQGKTYERDINRGPETWRERTWALNDPGQ